jgi:hypothetical protein
MRSALGRLPERYSHIRPRFTVRSLMIVVAVVSLILSLAAYEQRLKNLAIYHEARYLEQITPFTPTTPPSSVPGGKVHRSRLLDGTWTVVHTKTPLAEWHEGQKWGYMTRINNFHLLLLASIAGLVIVWLVCKAFSTKIRRARAVNRLVLEGDPHGRSEP